MNKEAEKAINKKSSSEIQNRFFSHEKVGNRDLPIDTQDNNDIVTSERREAYFEGPTQKLLRDLLKSGKKEEIIPTYDPAAGYVYEKIESLLREEGKDRVSTTFLERLTQLDILKKSFFDTVSTCPNCKSTVITLHYRCPICKGHHVANTSLTEHILCGYIDERDKYLQGRCPKCGVVLAESQHRDMGRWYICRECGDKFEHPQIDIVCRKCNTNFSVEEAKIAEIPKFSLNLERKKEIRQNVASLEAIDKILTQLDFEIFMPGLAIGAKSGMQHHFSLLAKKELEDSETIVAVDHAVAESEVQESPLILYIYKISEVKVDLPIFVAIPKLSETAKKIARGHKIFLIEGPPEEKSLLSEIKKEIESRLKEGIYEKPIAESKPSVKESKGNELGTLKNTPRRVDLKPQLISVTSTIHPYQEFKPKKRVAFVDTIKRMIKRNKKEDNKS